MDETYPNNISCMECGEMEFEEREGIFYCQECNAKQYHVRGNDVEEQEDELNHAKKYEGTENKNVKNNKPLFSVWEIYNHILRGFVNKLISLGAKEELKVMTLQVWAAYLKSLGIAFYDKKKPIQTKLQKDKDAINNHSRDADKKGKRKRSNDDESHCTSASKCQLTDSASEDTVLTVSSSSGNSNKADIFCLTGRQRKYAVKLIHETSAAKTSETGSIVLMMTMKQVIGVLGIALNLIQDDLQLCDLLRFLNDGILGTNNILQYFPPNTNKEKLDASLARIHFNNNASKFLDSSLRSHIGILCKNIGIDELETPDMLKLTKRFVSELCLPTEIATYCERLINISPPTFGTRSTGVYPNYEARAMAYIIFVLKLLFGLDGEKEKQMSKASKKLNRKIGLLNRKYNENQPLLFVWNEWVQYIEMRKVIIAKFNSMHCKNDEPQLEQMTEKKPRKKVFDARFIDIYEGLKSFVQIVEEADLEPNISFKPSLTPDFSNFKTILEYCHREKSLQSKNRLKIPNFMLSDHMQREVTSYIKVKPLIEYFENHQKELKAYALPVNQNRSYVGIFSTARIYPIPSAFQSVSLRTIKVSFDISEDEWIDKVTKEHNDCSDDLVYIKDFTNMSRNHWNRSRLKQYYDECINYELEPVRQRNTDTAPKINLNEINNLDSLNSFDVFDENNMDPITHENFITSVRRDLNQVNLFDDISDEESIINDPKSRESTVPPTPLPTSEDEAMSSGINNEIYIKEEEEFIEIGETRHNRNVKVPKDKTLKFYTSNMDCWMLLGSILRLTNRQKKLLHDKFPPSFAWLIQTCSECLNVDWGTIYEQLLAIELMFCIGIEDLEESKSHIHIKRLNKIKEIQALINIYRKVW